jgi:cystathionine beta-lyase/cystathionine gamma-synthase
VKKLSAGDHVVSEENTYGGTTRMFNTILARLGIEFTYVDGRDLDQIRSAIRPETKLIYLETPTNPMMRLTDLAAAAQIGRDAGIPPASTTPSPRPTTSGRWSTASTSWCTPPPST